MREPGERDGRSWQSRQRVTISEPPAALLDVLAGLRSRVSQGLRLTDHERGLLRDWALLRALESRRPAQLIEAAATLTFDGRYTSQPAPSEPEASTKPRALPEP